jgi:hypothetical protein
MSPRLTRLELALVFVVFAIGSGLRAAYPSRMAVEHFDEGVYASNLYTPDGRYPFQHLYAPPLLPFFLEWAAIFGGPHSVMWVNVISGSLTLLVLWGMVRQWWGPPAAIAAMVLLAFNEFHIAYSRAALTDAMLGLWMTAGVWAGWRAIQFGGAGNIAAAGVLASLAWWTKYNGWLTLAITGSGAAGWILFGGTRAATQASGGRQPPVEQPATSTNTPRKKNKGAARPPLAEAPKTDTVFGAARIYLGRWALTAAIAFLLWSPWLWDLQQYGGYAAVAKNHSGYFTGLGQWWANAVRQCAAIASGCHWLTQSGVAVAVVSTLIVGVRSSKLTPEQVAAQDDFDERPWTRVIRLPSTWIAAAWFIGLTVAVPLYQPYPRLCLPWLIGLVTLFGGLIANCGEWNDQGGRLQPVGFLAMIPAALLYFGGLTSRGGDIGCWDSRSSLEDVSQDVIAALQSQPLTRNVDGVRCVVSVVAEPGLYFHLGSLQRNSPVGHFAVPAADLGVARSESGTSEVPVYLVVGPHADQSEADSLIATGRVEQVAEFEYWPSNMVLLDSRPAWDLPPKDKPVVERVRLLHVKP